VLALTSSPDRLTDLRRLGMIPLLGQLDEPRTLDRLAGLASRVLHLAPPAAVGLQDARTLHLTQALAKRGRVTQWVYGSTTGVYGDCQGQWVDELRPVHAQTDRAMRRVFAEQTIRAMAKRQSTSARILRIPGIYAANRPGGSVKDKLLRGTPVLLAQDDVFTNHIHADDLARACWLALWRGSGVRTINVVDDTQMTMGDYYTWAAQHHGLPAPRRVSRQQAKQELSPMALSFMSESRRIDNARLKFELGLVLQYPTVIQGCA
jgi:nucleoside-diphosphate-sugar epimerase